MKGIVTFGLGAVAGVLLLSLAWLFHPLYKTTKVYVLDAPMVLSADQMDDRLHLLPKGTTLYFDQGFAEGFSRYKVYVNIDRTPLVLKELDDPTMIAPIQASLIDADELERESGKRPLTKQALRAMLASGGMAREEIEAVFDEFLHKRK
ncbi:MAG TPA: hypothetical protein VF800_27895 [Telluria sp.]|jgi:hypothetical protein